MLRKREGKGLIRQAHMDLISSGPAWLRKFGQLGLSQPVRGEDRDGNGALLLTQGYQTSAVPLAWQHHVVRFVLACDGARVCRGSKVSQRGQSLQLLTFEDAAHTL